MYFVFANQGVRDVAPRGVVVSDPRNHFLSFRDLPQRKHTHKKTRFPAVG